MEHGQSIEALRGVIEKCVNGRRHVPRTWNNQVDRARRRLKLG
jgi:hypothetical protein